MVRRFDINITCASCANKIEKILKQNKDLKFSINVLEKMLIVETDESNYDDEKIISLVAQAGFKAELI